MMGVPKSLCVVGLLLFLATGYAYVHVFANPDETAVAAYEKHFTLIADDIEPNDVILIHPPWRHDVKAALKKKAPKKHSNKITTVLSSTAGTRGKIIVLADTTAPPLSKRLRSMHAAQPQRGQDDVAIYFLQNDKKQAGTNFINLLPSATVKVKEENGKTTTCRWSEKNRRFKCPKLPNWMYVGPYQMRSGGDAKECIWSHPISKGQVHIRFPHPPLQSTLLFEHGFSDSAVRSNNKSPVTITIKQDENTLGRLTRARKSGFSQSSFIISTPSAQNLDLLIQTENDGAGHYCFNLITQNEAPNP